MRVLITGGATGLMRAIGDGFVAQVAICDNDARAVAAYARVCRDHIATCADVTDEAAMRVFLQDVETRWGGIDVVCANAGTVDPAGRIEDLDCAAWRGVSMRSRVSAQDVVDTVLFLASPQARRIFGQIMAIDGHTETLTP